MHTNTSLRVMFLGALVAASVGGCGEQDIAIAPTSAALERAGGGSPPLDLPERDCAARLQHDWQIVQSQGNNWVGYDFHPNGYILFPLGSGACDDWGQGRCDVIAGLTHFDSLQAVSTVINGIPRCACGCPEGECVIPPIKAAKLLTFDAAGNGTPAAPYEIYNATQLQSMARDSTAFTKHYRQCADIDLAGFYGPSKPFFTIGGDEPSGLPFTGSYNGNKHTISHFTFDQFGPHYVDPTLTPYTDVNGVVIRTQRHHAGLFTYANGATFRNLRLVEPLVRLYADADDQGNYAGFAVGALAGIAYGTSVDATLVTNPTVLGWQSIGGVIGYGNDVSVHATAVEGGTATGWYSVGGIIGFDQADSVLDHVQVRGFTPQAWEGEQGGLAGWFNGSITYSFADTSLLGGDTEYAAYYGGLVGTGTAMSIAWSWANLTTAPGVIARGRAIGGLVGRLEAGSIENSYATGSLATFADSYGYGGTGGVIGDNGSVGGSNASFIDNTYAAVRIISQGAPGAGAAAGFAIADVFHPAPAISHSFAVGPVSGTPGSVFAGLSSGTVDPTNRYNADVVGVVPGQGTPASLASGAFFDPNASFGYAWPTAPSQWLFLTGQLPTIPSAGL